MTVGSVVLPAPPAWSGSTARVAVPAPFAGLATAVVHLLPPEVPEAEQQRGDRPPGPEQPQVGGNHAGTAVGAAVLAERMAVRQVVLDLVDGLVPAVRHWARLRRPGPGVALGGVEPLRAEGAGALRGEQGVAYQRDEDRGRVDLEQRRHPAVVAGVLCHEQLDAVDDAGQVEPGPHEERQQLREAEDEDPGDQERQVVGYAAADALDDQAEDQEVDARVEQRSENLPELPELRLGVHRYVAR